MNRKIRSVTYVTTRKTNMKSILKENKFWRIFVCNQTTNGKSLLSSTAHTKSFNILND